MCASMSVPRSFRHVSTYVQFPTYLVSGLIGISHGEMAHRLPLTVWLLLFLFVFAVLDTKVGPDCSDFEHNARNIEKDTTRKMLAMHA